MPLKNAYFAPFHGAEWLDDKVLSRKPTGLLIGGIGVSGDTSCADHNIAWRTRHSLNLDFVPGGVSLKHDDNINYIGLVTGPSLANDFSHPICKIAGVDGVSAISAALPAVQKVQ